MGDIADWTNDTFWPGGSYAIGRKPAPRKPVECNRCHSRDVYWARTHGKHVLCDKDTDQDHQCKPTAEGFTDV